MPGSSARQNCPPRVTAIGSASLRLSAPKAGPRAFAFRGRGVPVHLPALVVFACLCELGVFLSYGVLLAVDAGELPDDVQSADYSLAYWKALENCEDGFPSATFCDRSETPRPPRSP